MLPEVHLKGAQKRAVRDALAPYLANADEADAALRELEALAAHYLGDVESGLYELEPPRSETLDELERVRAAADTLATALHDLSEPTRERLTDWVHHAPPPDEPEGRGPLAPLVPPETLKRCARDAGFLASRAAMLHDDVKREKRPVGRPRDWAALHFVSGLSNLWARYTGRALPRGNPDRTPWGRFVAGAVLAVGVDGDARYLARVVAESRRKTEKTPSAARRSRRRTARPTRCA